MGIDAFAIDRKLGQLLLHRLLFFQSGLTDVEQRSANQHVGKLEIALYESEGRITMQGGADEHGGLGMPIEQHVLPGDQDVVEDDEGVDFVEPIGQRIVVDGSTARKTRTADELEPG